MSSSHSADAGLDPAHQDPNVVDNGLGIRMPSGSEDPLTDAEIQRYREEINRLDRVILDAVKRRTEVSRTIGKTRMSSGGTRLVHTREIAILNEFRDELGEEGPTIASALLRLGRGKLG
ncbi:chorismate mutase [Corynebacterium sp. LaCa116]|uniref:chorismate mutase n=1 Tax=Corynebacterium sp. LaCa116 TaxID=3391423 RepID=UPI00398A3903